MRLSEEQKKAVQSSETPHCIDPDTNVEYVLIPFDVYQKLMQDSAADINPENYYPLIDEVMREDWDDPQMAEYDNYEVSKS